MKYNNYSIEDFASDPYFQMWVFEPNAMANKFWADWLTDHPEKRETVEKAKRLVLLLDRDEDKLSKKEVDAIWRTIIENRGVHKGFKKQNKGRYEISNLLKIAAVFIGLFALGFTAYYFNSIWMKESSKTIASNRITLELEDGSIVFLDEVNSETITNKTKAVVSDKNTLSYKNAEKDLDNKLVYNKITVPYGKIFELELSDGSRVKLNAGTKLRYPVRFLKNTPRNVYLEGEAFFEVAKDKKNAFTVVTNKMNTRVYGTKFNVSCYKNEHKIATVLVEGSVGVYKANGEGKDHPTLIKPGYRALFKNDAIGVSKVDVSKYTAWTDEKLVFMDDSFDVIVKRLERKYDVKIINQYTELNGKKFTGIFKKESLEDVLRIFREHTHFNYTIKEKSVVITN